MVKNSLSHLEIEITTPHFNSESYLKLETLTSIKYIEITFAIENYNGLILYCDNESIQFYFTVSIRNKTIDIT